MKESSIQKKIIQSHESDGWIVVKLIQTTMNGIPDLLLLRNGRIAFVEVKRKGEKSTPLQIYIQNKIRSKNIDVFVTSNPDFHL